MTQQATAQSDVPETAVTAIGPEHLAAVAALDASAFGKLQVEEAIPATWEERAKLAYLPFGAGPRICIGNHFALMEAKIILATIVQRWSISVDAPEAVRFDPSVTLRPAGGLPGRLHALA